MSDIIERDFLEKLKKALREGYEFGDGSFCFVASRDLESLIAEIERLRAGYRQIIETWRIAKETPGQVWPMEVEREVAETMVDIAIHALEQKP